MSGSLYIDADELRDALAPELTAELDALGDERTEMLLADSCNDVDRAIGGPRDPQTGRAVALADLSAVQAAAVRRATVEAGAFRLEDADSIRGGSEYLAGQLALAWRGPRPPSPAVVEALDGYGLIRRSGLAEEVPP